MVSYQGLKKYLLTGHFIHSFHAAIIYQMLIMYQLETAREFQKNIYFCFIDYATAFVWITTNCGFLKRWEYQTILPASWETCMKVKKQQLKSYMEQWTGSKLGKEYIKAVSLSPWLFNLNAEYIMLDEAQAGIKIARRNYQ